MDEYKEKLGSQKRAVDDLMASIKDETKSYNERYNAMVQLQEMFPDHVKGMNLLAMSTAELTKLQREYNDELGYLLDEIKDKPSRIAKMSGNLQENTRALTKLHTYLEDKMINAIFKRHLICKFY